MPKYLFFIVIFSLLGGCAWWTEKPRSAADLAISDFAMSDFAIEGKLAVRFQDKNQAANFRWRQTDGRYEVEMWGLLGQGRSRLHGTASQLTVSRGEQVLAVGRPRTVMLEHLGFSLPIAVLSSWLAGQPAETGNNRVLDEQGRLVGFSERGWQVILSKYRQISGQNSKFQPSRIVATQDEQKITVAIRRFLQ